MSTNDWLQEQHRFQCKFQHKLSKNKNYPDFRFSYAAFSLPRKFELGITSLTSWASSNRKVGKARNNRICFPPYQGKKIMHYYQYSTRHVFFLFYFMCVCVCMYLWLAYLASHKYTTVAVVAKLQLAQKLPNFKLLIYWKWFANCTPLCSWQLDACGHCRPWLPG